MPTVTGTLKLNDRMTSVLKSVVTAINSTLGVMERMDIASSSAFRSAQHDAALAAAAVNDFTSELAAVPAAAQSAENGVQRLFSKALSLGAVLYGLRTAVSSAGSVTNLSDSMSRSLSRLDQINRRYGTMQKSQENLLQSANRAPIELPKAADMANQFAVRLNPVLEPARMMEQTLGGQFQNSIGQLYEAAAASVAASAGEVQASFRSGLTQIDNGYRTTLEYQDMIFRSADRARSNYLETVDAVSKFGANAGDAFSSTDEIIAFTELMNKSFKLAGTAAEEQAGAMRQLSQAMASGLLRGDEFNSIAEQAPMVYEAIANYLGKSKGEVRELAAEGEITATIVKNAMFTAAGDIENRFNDTPLTIADHMERMQNAALQAFSPVLSRINEVAQSERFAQFTQDIANMFYTMSGYALDFINTIALIGAFVQDNGDAIVVCIGAIAVALTVLNAKTIATGIVAVATAIQSGAAWFAAAWPILLIVGILAGLVIAYQNTSGATQALIAAIGMVVLAIGAWVAIQWALNFAQAANPIGALIMAIVVLIGVVIAIIAWIYDLWKTNLDFKYGVLAIWDSIVFFFKSIPLFFQKVGYGIADAFSYAKVTVLNILQNMANGAINIVNNLIALLNKIPGVAIDPIEQLTFAATAAAEEEAHRQSRANTLTQAESALAAQKLMKQAERTIDRMADQSETTSKAITASNKKSTAEQVAGGNFDYSKYLSNNASASGGGSLGDIGKVGSVGKIDSDITISEEDIKLLKDVATMEYQLRYTQLTPHMQVTFGDVRETADAERILEYVENKLEEALSSSLYVEVKG